MFCHPQVIKRLYFTPLFTVNQWCQLTTRNKGLWLVFITRVLITTYLTWVNIYTGQTECKWNLILLLQSFKLNIRPWGKDLFSGLSASTPKTLFSEFRSVLIIIHTWIYNIIPLKKEKNKYGINRIREKLVLLCFMRQLHPPPFP